MIRYAILVASALALAVPSDADACGGFFPRRATKTVPSLQVEQVLILHDPAKEEEHFIRQLVFQDAAEPFGFVVPTPSQPTVAKVEGSPFRALAKRYRPERIAVRGPGGKAGGGGRGGVDGAVKILSQQRIGSFTAFTLAATDGGALERWLGENGFDTTPESAAWLARYVRLGFFYTAFRYEPRSSAPGELAAETVRISFATPVPFYPYAEPRHPDAPKADRVLAVWLVSTERAAPVASHDGATGPQLEQPWLESPRYVPTTTKELGRLLGSLAPLVPQAGASLAPITGGSLYVQAFEDQKQDRHGWGDVLLVPEETARLDPARRARILKLGAALEATR